MSGRTNRELKRLIKSGSIVRTRPSGGKITISIPQIEIPRFVHGSNGNGVGRGPGKEGDIVGRDPKTGKGQGNAAGSDEGEGLQITIDLKEIMDFMEEQLKLPRIKPKPSETFEEIKIKYNSLSKNGPESLRHNRRTMREALKRLAMTGDLDNLYQVPGSKVPIKLIELINSDRRYRQYNELKIPSSNAVILFARDCSMSMDNYRCDIVTDMSWWLDCWIRRFYDKVIRCYFIHDTRAEEVDEKKFYKYRYGGGTLCSSAFKLMAEQLKNRFPPHKHNIYIFYFSDGENWEGDNEKMVEIIKKELGPDKVNLIGITQVCAWRYENSVKKYIDDALSKKILDASYINTAYIGPEMKEDKTQGFVSGNWGYTPELSEEDRNDQIIDAIRAVLTSEGEKA